MKALKTVAVALGITLAALIIIPLAVLAGLVIALGEVVQAHVDDVFILDAAKFYVDTPAMHLIGRMHGLHPDDPWDGREKTAGVYLTVSMKGVVEGDTMRVVVQCGDFVYRTQVPLALEAGAQGPVIIKDFA